MESHRAVRIWGRTESAINPSVNVQSVPSLTVAPNHANAERPLINEDNQNQENRKPLLDYRGSPCKNRCLTIGEVPVKGGAQRAGDSRGAECHGGLIHPTWWTDDLSWISTR